MAKSRTTLRANLNTYTGDSTDTIWTEAQKNLALNMAIQSAWPELKTTGYTTFPLAEGSYNYKLPVNSAYAFTRAPYGPQQIWAATCVSSGSASPVFREMRRDVIAKLSVGEWYLEFDPDYVDARDNYLIEVNFNQQFGELGSDSDTTDVPEAYLLPRSLFELCGMEQLTGHHTDIKAFRDKAPEFYEQAERAKMTHRTEALPTVIKVRWE